MGRLRGTKLRLFAAVICAATWAFAFLLVPALHLIRHRADHVHLANGATQFTHAHAQAHQHGRPHGHSPSKQKQKDEHRDRGSIPLDHGAGTLAHFGAATVLQTRAAVLPASTLIRAIDGPRPRSIPRIKSLHLAAVSARGPPTI